MTVVSFTGTFPVVLSVCGGFFWGWGGFFFFFVVLAIGQVLQSLVIPLSNYKCHGGNVSKWNAAEVRKALEVTERQCRLFSSCYLIKYAHGEFIFQ